MERLNEKSEEEQIKDLDDVAVREMPKERVEEALKMQKTVVLEALIECIRTQAKRISIDMQKIKIEHERWMFEQEYRRQQWLEGQKRGRELEKQERELEELRWTVIRDVGAKVLSKATPLIEAIILSKDLGEDYSIFIAEIQKGGRVAIPKPFRKYHHLEEGDLVTVTVKQKQMYAHPSLKDKSMRQDLIP